MAESVVGWHFLAEDCRLQYRSRRKVEPGMTCTVRRPLKLCSVGLHASERAIDALQYAPGPVICRVELSGGVVRGDDKLCASRRKVLWMAEATKTLHLFACDVAEIALRGIASPDPRSLATIKTKRLWLENKATDSDLSAARSAGWSATATAADSAAWSAAWTAALSAAESDAWSAAGATAWSAAESAAKSVAWSGGAAAWSAARSDQNEMLEAAFFALEPK